MSEMVIKIENLYKQYRLGVLSHRTLYKDVQSWWAKARGKEDPNQTVDHVTLKKIEQTENGRFWALNDISLDVRQGEVLGIIGRNGAGKSTLLKILSRVTTPTKGQIKIKGRIASLLEVGTGFHPELTGRENVYLNGAIMGMTKSEISRKFDEIVDFSGISEFIGTPVKRYSSGMYVRLAFAVAAHLEPEILVVDEVLAVGDIDFQKKCLGKMKDVAEGGRTVLFVSHNMDAINKLCAKAILLSSGEIMERGNTNEVVKNYLKMEFKEDALYEQGEDKNKAINLRKITLLDSARKINAKLDYNKNFYVVIEYEVHQIVKGCYIWFTLKTLDDNIVFQTLDYDLNPSFIVERQCGYYNSEVEIPAKWLNAGQYKISFGITSYHIRYNYDRIDALSFKIIDNNDYLLAEAANRAGFLRPELLWRTKKL
ncbi:MAG: hypothetical protein COA57_01535 [Flavobacteriales bacterium]|nr:MAG: hypothetical protein COA57_01535 [Flavobacteriales bacterium]